MKKNIGKKAFFFFIDSILALGVLAIGGFIAFTVLSDKPVTSGPEIISEDILDFFSNSRIQDVNNEYAGLGGTLWQQGMIDNAENTLLQQLAIFYVDADLDTAKTFIDELTKNIIPTQNNFEFWMDGTLLFPNEEQTELKKKARVLIPTKRIVYSIRDAETGELIGPYEAKVFVWQQ
jgi:hypothetical protein